MAHVAIPYDASRTALYMPERSEPTPDFSVRWPVDCICGELSRLAYYRFENDSAARLNAALVRAGFAAAATFTDAKAGAHGFATRLPDGSAIVALRGTQPDSLRAIIADARANLVAFGPGAKVHAGFLAAYRAIEDELAQWLGAAAGGGVVFTGHSLGAAVATIAAASHPGSLLVSFGSPRVGDRGFAQLFDGRAVRRYVDCTDLVTAIPPALVGYAHVGADLYADRVGTVHEPALSPAAVAEDRRLARRTYLTDYAWKIWRNVAVRDLADHAPVNYISSVLGRRSPS